MKIVAYSDLHAHPFKGGQIISEGRNSRVDDAVAVINQVYDHATLLEDPVVLFGGDLFDRRKSLDVDTFNRIHATIMDRSMETCRTIMIPGNHDQANKSGSIHALERFNASYCTVVSEPRWLNVGDGIGVFAAPYVDDGEDIAASVAVGLSERPEWAESAVLLMHYGVQGAKVGPADYVLPCELELPMLHPDQWNLMLSGHYHMGQQLGDRFHYIGSAMQHRWDDVGDTKSFMVIDPEDWSIERVATNAPQFLVITGKTKDYDVENCFVKIVRDYEIEAEKKERLRRKLLERGALSVIIEPPSVKPSKNMSERIEFSEDRGAFGILEDYINSDLVGTGGLDTERLISVGKGILEQASA